MAMAPIIIEVAINGGVTPDRNPHVPLKAADITADCLRCYDAGATVIHAHNHDIRLNHQAGAEAYLGKPLDLTALDRLLGRQGLYRPLGQAGSGAQRPGRHT